MERWMRRGLGSMGGTQTSQALSSQNPGVPLFPHISVFTDQEIPPNLSV